MAKGAEGPMTVYEDRNGELQRLAFEYQVDTGAVIKIETELNAAKTTQSNSLGRIHDYTSDMVAAIHELAESQGEDLNPSEYLQAYLNTRFELARPGLGDDFADRLQPLREVVQQGSVPITIIGGKPVRSDEVGLRFGLTAGDISVRRPAEYETGYSVAATGLITEIPLHKVIDVQSPYLSSFDHPREWRYIGLLDANYRTAFPGYFGNLAIAGTAEDVARNEKNYDDVQFVTDGSREPIAETGFPRMVAFGPLAVGALMKRLCRNEGMASYVKYRREDVLAAAITLGMRPEQIAEVDPDELKETLTSEIAEYIKCGVAGRIYEEFNQRAYGYQKWEHDRPVTTTPEVKDYLQIPDETLIQAAKAGIVRDLGHLKTDAIDDWGVSYSQYAMRKDGPSEKEPDGRLLVSEATGKASTFLTDKYGLDVAQSDLKVDVEEQLQKRLQEVREQYDRIDDMKSGRIRW